MNPVFLEICCGSLDDAIQADLGGADRAELCSCLFHGGLTPSIGAVVEAKKRLSIPFVAMVRPRGGGFAYTEAEFAQMQIDAVLMLQHGAAGIVFGILNEDGTLDVERNHRLVEIAGDAQTVFHRAIDVTPDPFRALDQLIEMGVTRVLTSGQEPSVPEGAELISRLIEHAAGRIEVMPGGGITPRNLDFVLKQTGAKWIHLAAWKSVEDASCRVRPAVTFGGALYPPEDRYDVTDREVVAGIAKRLKV
jgi:copper homeostasis protein